MTVLDVRSIDARDLRKVPSPEAKQGFRVFLAEEAFDRVVERGASDTAREVGGVLVGELLRDDAGPYLRITTTIDALHAEEKGAELTFTHATWEHIHREMDTRHAGQRVVGWYHTHPGFGVFLSDRDQFIHKSFFNLPFQVAFVYDPKSREHGMFAWHDNEAQRARRYWIGAHEHAWDGSRTAPEVVRPAPEERAAARPAEAAAQGGGAAGEPASLGSILPLVVIGLVLLLVGGAVGRWFGLGAADQLMVEVQHELSKARTDGAQAAVASLQGELVGMLRDTLGDEALRRPVTEAIEELDRLAAGLAASGEPALAARADEVRLARARLAQLLQSRGAAQAVLGQLELLARRGGPRVDLSREVAQQRAGLGALYAELAAEAVKARDPVRARRLLSAAALHDPGNRARYEEQLRSFDRAGRLPREAAPAPGVAPAVTPAPVVTPAPTPGAPPAAIPAPAATPAPVGAPAPAVAPAAIPAAIPAPAAPAGSAAAPVGPTQGSTR